MGRRFFPETKLRPADIQRRFGYFAVEWQQTIGH
jgi:hypothetical protein